jgi:HlyD family secretion protein
LAAILFVWLKSGRSEDLANKYQTALITEGDLRVSVTAVGNLKPVTEITVGSEISGIIKEIRVDSNAPVTKGQEIARIDTARLEQQADGFRAAVGHAATRVDEANATLKEAQLTYNRQKDLFEKSQGRTPARVVIETVTADLERAKAALEAAEATRSEASARLAAAETDISKAIIRSPVDGVVLSRNYEPGQTVAAGYKAPELFVIAEKLENMKVVVGVAEADVVRVAVGQKATFTVDAWGKKAYPAEVTKVETAGTNTDNVVTYNVELKVPNVALSLRTGMTATATIQTNEVKHVLLAPAEALAFTPRAGTGAVAVPAPTDESGVLWVIRNNRLVPLNVKVGLHDVHTVEVSGPEVTSKLSVVIGEKAKKK